MGILMITQEKVNNIYTPLAELAGELSGALANPEAFQSYAKSKRTQDAIEKGEALHEIGDKGGMAVANTTFKDGKIVNSATGEELMTTEMLEELINKGFAGT